MMRQIGTCRNCPYRYRKIEGDKIVDCHDSCERYQEAFDRATEIVQTARKQSKADLDLLNYHIQDKEKRRRSGRIR